MKPELIEETIKVWQPFSPTPITVGDAEEMVRGIVGYLAILKRWKDAEEQQADMSLCARLSS